MPLFTEAEVWAAIRAMLACRVAEAFRICIVPAQLPRLPSGANLDEAVQYLKRLQLLSLLYAELGHGCRSQVTSTGGMRVVWHARREDWFDVVGVEWGEPEPDAAWPILATWREGAAGWWEVV